LRRVPRDSGRITFRSRRWRIPKAFKGKTVAIRPTHTDGLYDVVFRTANIATIDLSPEPPSSTCHGCLRTPVTDLSGLNT